MPRLPAAVRPRRAAGAAARRVRRGRWRRWTRRSSARSRPSAWLSTGIDAGPRCLDWPADPTAGSPLRGLRLPDVPVLVQSGDLDTNTPVEQGRPAAAQFRHSIFAVVANAGHTPDLHRCGVAMALDFIRHLTTNPNRCRHAGRPPRVVGRPALRAAQLPLPRVHAPRGCAERSRSHWPRSPTSGHSSPTATSRHARRAARRNLHRRPRPRAVRGRARRDRRHRKRHRDSRPPRDTHATQAARPRCAARTARAPRRGEDDARHRHRRRSTRGSAVRVHSLFERTASSCDPHAERGATRSPRRRSGRARYPGRVRQRGQPEGETFN